MAHWITGKQDQSEDLVHDASVKAIRKADSFKGGKFKDMGGFWRGPTPEESEKFQGLITEIYDNFVSVVSQGRSMDDAAVRELATGEVMTSKKGIGLGLVDEIGDFDRAVAVRGRRR